MTSTANSLAQRTTARERKQAALLRQQATLRPSLDSIEYRNRAQRRHPERFGLLPLVAKKRRGSR